MDQVVLPDRRAQILVPRIPATSGNPKFFNTTADIENDTAFDERLLEEIKGDELMPSRGAGVA